MKIFRRKNSINFPQGFGKAPFACNHKRGGALPAQQFRRVNHSGMDDVSRTAKVRGLLLRMSTLNSDERFSLVETLGFEDVPGRNLLDLQQASERRARRTYEIAAAAMHSPAECEAWITLVQQQLKDILQQPRWTEDDGVRIEYGVFVLERLVGGVLVKCFQNAQHGHDFSYYAVNFSSLLAEQRDLVAAYSNFDRCTGRNEKPSGSLQKEFAWGVDQLLGLTVRSLLVGPTRTSEGSLLICESLLSNIQKLPDDSRLVQGESLETARNIFLATCPPFTPSSRLQHFTLDCAFVFQALVPLIERAKNLSSNPQEFSSEMLPELMMSLIFIGRLVDGWSHYLQLTAHEIGFVEHYQMPQALIDKQREVFENLKMLNLHLGAPIFDSMAAQAQNTLLWMNFHTNLKLARTWRPAEVLAIDNSDILLQAISIREFPPLPASEQEEFVRFFNENMIANWPSFRETLRQAGTRNEIGDISSSELSKIYACAYPLALLERLRDLASSDTDASKKIDPKFFEVFFGDLGREVLAVALSSPGEKFRSFFYIEDWLLATWNDFQADFFSYSVKRALADPTWFTQTKGLPGMLTTMVLSAYLPAGVSDEPFWSAEEKQRIIGDQQAQDALLAMVRALPLRTRKASRREWVDMAVKAGGCDAANRDQVWKLMGDLLQI